jgi:hypothetical protein
MIIIFQYPLSPVRALTAQPGNWVGSNMFRRPISAGALVKGDYF